jgi:hypothetical protein
MKTLIKSKLALLVIAAGLAFSCKKNETAPTDGYGADTTMTAVDTANTTVDSTTVNSGTNGTTGATGEGSTGSGAAGTTQQGNSSVRTDSTTTTTPRP